MQVGRAGRGRGDGGRRLRGAEPGPKWGAHLDLEGKAGSERNLGEADLFLPVLQDDDTLLFASIRTRLDDQSSREGNFGLGLRHMLESGWNLGTYGYFDRRRTEHGSLFNQATIGAEALGRDFDLRANGYIGLGSGRRVLSDHSSGGDATASVVGTTVVVNVGEASRTVTEERSLSGFDAEIGWRVPVFDPEEGIALRLYGGGYAFSAAEVPDVAGPRGRLELTMDQVPGLWDGARLTLGGEVQHDDPRGTQGFLSARLRIPLGGGAEASRLSAQERRMTDPIVRDIDVVSSGAMTRRTVTAPGSTEIATATADGKALTILDSATTTGAALPGAVTAAGNDSLVVLSGTFKTSATVVLQTGQTVMGAGTLTVRTPSGHTATLTTPGATIAAESDWTLYAVTMGANSTLEGLTVSNLATVQSSVYAIRSTAGGVTIRGNTISVENKTSASGSTATAIVASGPSTVIHGNTISAIGRGLNTTATAVDARNASNITISANTITTDGKGSPSYSITGNGGTTFTAASTGNVLVSGTCGGGGSTGAVYFTNGTHCP